VNLVVDASVALKWFFRARAGEVDIEPALTLLAGLDTDRFRLWQPPHFLAEIASVLAREKPKSARDDLADLKLIKWQTVEDAATFETAMDLSMRLNHHLFDTLYHAVALRSPDAILLTADRTYFRKAREEGRIVLLSQFDMNS